MSWANISSIAQLLVIQMQNNKRALRFKYSWYQLVNGTLFRDNNDETLFIHLEKEDVDKVLKKMHNGPTWGNFSRENPSHKILKDDYYWPALFCDTHAYVRNCEIC